jgi:HAD superfamily hydrolase (TIGR01509 family)
MTRNFDGALFDGDGTLYVTEPIFIESYRIVCERRGVDFAQVDYASIVARPIIAVLGELSTRFGLGLDATEWYEELRLELYGSGPNDGQGGLIESAVLRVGAAELLDRLESEGVPYAIATNAPAHHMRRMTRLFPRLGRVPQLHREHPAVGGLVKPHPQPFLAAAAALGIDPRRAVAFEDSPKGLESALAAGCYTVALPHEHSPAPALAAAHLIVHDLGTFDMTAVPPLPLVP